MTKTYEVTEKGENSKEAFVVETNTTEQSKTYYLKKRKKIIKIFIEEIARLQVLLDKFK